MVTQSRAPFLIADLNNLLPSLPCFSSSVPLETLAAAPLHHLVQATLRLLVRHVSYIARPQHRRARRLRPHRHLSNRGPIQNRPHGRLAQVPPPRRQQPRASKNWIHDPPARFVEQRPKRRWSQMRSRRMDEVDEAGAAVEFGQEDGGVGLRLRRPYPLKAWPDRAFPAASLSQHSATVAA
ncbi:hypothetical protein PIB30_084592 [Stylosanthes scabra]|uniref:Uncharacterized protein n=1 Tax=Stylosanthes scabra TaxID=79078 RepID=A0ABU6YQ68_9FABA|nr:hypothetical protein [Stylosanthes scabra]